MSSEVVNQKPFIVLPSTSKVSSFTSDQFPINNTENQTIQISTISSSSLNALVKAQVSLDGSSWFDLSTKTVTITGDDNKTFSIESLKSFMYMRISVTISSGSAIFSIIARCV